MDDLVDHVIIRLLCAPVMILAAREFAPLTAKTIPEAASFLKLLFKGHVSFQTYQW